MFCVAVEQNRADTNITIVSCTSGVMKCESPMFYLTRTYHIFNKCHELLLETLEKPYFGFKWLLLKNILEILVDKYCLLNKQNI